jgi:hypothetical protein
MQKRKVTPRVPKETPMFEDPPHNTMMSRTWVIFLERLGQSWTEVEDPELKATFGLVRTLEVEDDLTLRFLCKRAGRFIGLHANGKLPATGSTVKISIEKWKYDATYLGEGEDQEWINIFADREEEEETIPGYIELADFDAIDPPLPTGTPYLEVFSPAAANVEFKAEHDGADGQIAVGDMLRINCLQVGSDYAGKGYEIVLHWEPLQ